MVCRLSVIGIVAAAQAFAQAPLGVAALRGTVQDESHGAIPSVAVSLTDLARGFVRRTTSDNGGSFTFPAIRAGTYRVRAEKPGFRSEEILELKIDVGEQACVSITLAVGAVQSAVTVSAPTVTELTAESNTLGSVIETTLVKELPLNGRNFIQLAKLSAGTVDLSPASNLFSSNVGPPDRTIVLPGTLPNSVSYSLNGIDVTSSRSGELALSPSVVAIDQFRVQQSFLMPSQGANPAVINVVTTAGTQAFRGEVWEFLRNRALDARSFFAPRPEDLKRNQFGVAAGGPLWRNRAWFYGFFEGIRERTAFFRGGFSPTNEMFGGNFAGTGRTIYDPETSDPVTGSREPFPNNRIPANRMNAVARNLLNFYLPGSSLSVVPFNFQANPANTLDDNQGGIRIDVAANPRQQVFVQLFKQSTPTRLPDIFPLSGLQYLNNSDVAMLRHTWTLKSRAVNDLRAGFFRNTALGSNEALGSQVSPASLGIANTVDTAGVPAVNLQGYSSFGRAAGEVGNRDNTWQVNNESTIGTPKHTIAFGAGLLYRRGWHANGNSVALGSLAFQSNFTAQLTRNAAGQYVPRADTGDAFADFLLGLPTTGLLTGGSTVPFRSTRFVPFLQDSWRVTSDLTLNYGLLWFVETLPMPLGPARDMVHTLDRQSGLLQFAGLGQVEPQIAATDRNNFAPRFGLAWSPEFLPKTVFRIAGGLYYSAFPWSFAAYPVGPGSPSSTGASFTNSLTNPQPTFSLGANVFPKGAGGVLTPDYAASLPQGTVATALNPNFRTGYSSQWNLSMQHSFGPADFVELSYLGSSAHRLPNVLDLAQCQPTAALFCSPHSKPYPRYGLLLYGDSSGNSSYEALLAKYARRMSSGIALRVEYTFAKALTDTYQSSLSIFNQISSCRSCSKGPATFDVRHRAVASLVWDLPVGHGRRFHPQLRPWWDQFAGGWTVSAIATFATGQPVILSAPNQTGSAFITPLPNRGCDGRSDAMSGNLRSNGFLWFDTSCFAVPSLGYFGNSGPTVIPSPGINNWDFGLHKSFSLPSSTARLQFRAELFNAWNHTQWERPNGNAGTRSNFGRISATRYPRLVQLALKFLW